ncbi:adenosylcobinamide-GDP ribazoletransferase [Jeotgalibacillus sp. R-1-5s-1]|uniref:adenosylcobinamide-GDP ribazoletransferase n=1 Tax=Jeotgalibacillus sp. R-1-5s-1 TaxID=2555897 RepID=UPI00106C8405|nr:adenosylcobinamide-GDP ribazoletransferase [Jeotgalibacillus sp. R-1-5s-1]TFD92927.1 adenosylcobinamide-GDP ribazoletransferase [Jeotgalibacillus sp. R-1-5s-1]
MGRGLLLMVQFFTVIPLRQEIRMDHKSVPWMISFLPVAGLLISSVLYSVVWLAEGLFSASPLMIAFLVWISLIMLTGGLHLDGWTDMSDAYFSYRSLEKRHEILKDPRVGAFGVLSLIVLLTAKLILLIDLANRDLIDAVWLFWMLVLSRTVAGLLLINSPLARTEGLAFFFRGFLDQKDSWKVGAVCIMLVLTGLLVSVGLWPLLLLLSAGALLFSLCSLHFFKKEFGGFTGDSLGACIEGGELWSLILVWCYLSIVMG